MATNSTTTLPPRDEGGVAIWQRPIVVVVVCTLLLLIIAVLMPTPVTGIDSGLKWIGAMQYAATSSIELPTPPTQHLPRATLPPCPAPFLFENQGHLMPVFLPLPMVLNGILFRFIPEGVIWWFWSLLPTIGLLFLAFRYLPEDRSPWLKAGILLVGTPFAVYAVVYWEHALAAFLCAFGVIGSQDRNRWFRWLSTVALAVAPWIRVETIGWSVPVVLYLLWSDKKERWVRPVLAISVFLVLGVLHKHWTGSPFPLQLSENYQTGLTLWSQVALGKLPFEMWFNMLLGSGGTGWNFAGLLCLVVGLHGWWKGRWWQWILLAPPLLYIISILMQPTPVFGMLFSSGVMYTIPALGMALMSWKHLEYNRLWLLASFGLVLVVLLMGQVAQGVHWSVRYLLPIGFPVALACWYGLKNRPVTHNLQFMLVFSWLGIAILGWWWHYAIAERQVRMRTELAELNVPILTEVAWLGGDAAPLLKDKEIAFVQDRDHFGRAMIALKRAGVPGFALIRMPQVAPRSGDSRGWTRLVDLQRISDLPTPERGFSYRVEHYRFREDMPAFGQLAGELATLRFLDGDPRGIEDVKLALHWNPADLRPALALLTFAMERRDARNLREVLTFLTDKPIPQKYIPLIDQAQRLFRELSNKQ